ncbi:MAG: cadmium-translocating P-type ATPase [Actinomycetota bacterium]|nr:cadmium-translocating P-type ATPase [Actinomycetota bacterium]PLS75685.1 MAG: cadmium-translocating P-type ATPase [Actinomycetota bacterium]
MSGACCNHGQEAQAEEAPERLWEVRSIQLAAVAGVLLVSGLVMDRAGVEAIGIAALYLTLLVGGSTFVPDTVVALRRRRIGVGTLMSVAAVGAVLLGELGEAATLAFLFSISEGLEAYSLARTRRGLRALLSLAPDEARVVRDGQEVVVAPRELAPGDRMVVRPGERLATDGVVQEGRTTLDVSSITGESIPVEAGPGATVYAGSINGRGVLEVAVTSSAEDNSLARMVRIVEEAQERKGASQRLADRFAAPLVPGVLVVAAAIAVIGSAFGDPEVWIERALVVLVAAAPCAFAISVPVAVVSAIGAASRSGVLIKGGAALEAMGRVRIVALDKTGTLTRNDPRVVEVIATDGADPQEVLAVAAALEARSEHPLGRAILAASPDPGPASDVQAVAGHGLVGMVGRHEARLGRPGFIGADGLEGDVRRMQEAGATAVLIELDGIVIGAIGVRDELRPEAAVAVASLRRAGLEVAMLTGDNRPTAQALGQEAGITDVRAELLPADKAAMIEGLGKQAPVAMVGDGINDAPALATADVGIAMGAMGTDVAIETADVALMGEDLRHLPQAFAHARHAATVMRQNLVLSGSILLILVPLAATGALGLAAVVATHELAEVVVIANGVRSGRRSAVLSALREETPGIDAKAGVESDGVMAT